MSYGITELQNILEQVNLAGVNRREEFLRLEGARNMLNSMISSLAQPADPTPPSEPTPDETGS